MRNDYSRDILPLIANVGDNWEVEVIGEVGQGSLFLPIEVIYDREEEASLPYVFLSAGMHGYEEPAGIFALLDFLKKEGPKYRPKVNFVAVPCVNPCGYELGKRYNAFDYDPNRTFYDDGQSQESKAVIDFLREKVPGYAFAIDLHEDNFYRNSGPEMEDGWIKEFYLYESRDENLESLGSIILERVEKGGYPICRRPYIYEEPCTKGLVRSPARSELPKGFDGTLECFMRQYTNASLTLETPTYLTLEDRVELHKLAIRAALESII